MVMKFIYVYPTLGKLFVCIIPIISTTTPYIDYFVVICRFKVLGLLCSWTVMRSVLDGDACGSWLNKLPGRLDSEALINSVLVCTYIWGLYLIIVKLMKWLKWGPIWTSSIVVLLLLSIFIFFNRVDRPINKGNSGQIF